LYAFNCPTNVSMSIVQSPVANIHNGRSGDVVQNSPFSRDKLDGLPATFCNLLLYLARSKTSSCATFASDSSQDDMCDGAAT
jgi:hypothetical protein